MLSSPSPNVHLTAQASSSLLILIDPDPLPGSEVGWKVSVAFGTTLALSGYVYPTGAKGGGPYLGNAPPQTWITPQIGWSMDRP